MDNRRRAERHPAIWMGYCQVENESSESSDSWLDCGVFDFSSLGMGMDFRYPDSSQLVGRRISVSLPVGGSVNVSLTGEVRNARGGPDGIARAGVEFVGLSETECWIVDLLERHSMSWPRA